MDEQLRPVCKACGLKRMCFPGKLAGLRVRRIRAERGMPLFRCGDRVDSLYMIRSGCIKEIEEGGEGNASVVNFALAGDMLSLQGLGPAPSRTSAIAVEATSVCVVPWNDFNQACATSPETAGEFIRLIAKAGVAARESLALVRDKEAYQRVAGFLLNMLGRMQAGCERVRDFRLGMNREDIANYLGIRSETVSRCFTELARRRLIDVRAKRVQILQMGELRKLYAGA